MMWDIGGNGLTNPMSDRNRSRSPHPRMPSPTFHSQSNGNTGVPFMIRTPSSPSFPVNVQSTNYNPYHYPSMTHAPSAPPAPLPSNQVPHRNHHSKHHSSSKKIHNNPNKHSGHGHSHSHSHPHPHSQPLPLPSPSFPQAINPSTSFPAATRSPHVHFPSVPHRPLVHSSSSNALLQPTYMQPQPAKQTHHDNKAVKKHKQYKSTYAPIPMNPDFQYSKCTGRRRALCIGINYRGQPFELRGCVNDANNVRRFLTKNNYRDSEIMMLTDDTNDPRRLPTYDNILAAMRWLVSGAQSHDSLFFHFSGHGGQTPDLDGDEADGMDEVIYPLDYQRKKFIVDDLINEIMVKPLPRGCRLTGLFDACHSGSVLDLQYVYSSHGRLKASPIARRAWASKATSADVISWSSCRDGQTSADTFAAGIPVGAMSNAFVKSLTNKPDQTYQELLRSIRLNLQAKYSQVPQLGSSHHIDTNLRFVF